MYTYNKLHTCTYIQLLQKVYILFATMVFFSGCLDEKEVYIQDHTNASKTFVKNEYKINIKVEDKKDLDNASILDLFWIQKQIHQTIIPDDKGIKKVNIFIASTENSFEYVCYRAKDKKLFGCIDVFEMVDGIINIYYNPNRWRSTKENTIETFIHELIHYVSYKLDGNGDGGHSNPDYWGKNGLLKQIYNEWKNNNL